MTILNETIRLDRPAREVFAYVADFTTCTQWDSTAIEATRLDDGPLAVGSRFRVRCAAPLGSLVLDYKVLELTPDRCVVLLGRGRLFDVKDTIRITPAGSGCELSYTAEFFWKPAIAPFADRLRSGLERMGHNSVQIGLKRALQDALPAPEVSEGKGPGDRFLPSAVFRFTRFGYRRARRHWKPVSAYVRDKHIVVTGATAGLGRACSRQLARLGARLTLVVRDREKGEALVRELEASTGNQHVNLQTADLSRMVEVDKVIAALTERGEAVDVLINNAGALFNPRALTDEGLEMSFALLLLAPYRLTEGLYPLLKQAQGKARVINVVSGGMYTQRLHVDDLQSEKGPYSGAVAYARAKRALMIKTEQWAEDWADDGIVVNAMHPGWADTPGIEAALPVFHKITRWFLRTPAEGADTTVWLAVATEAGKVTGKLFLDRSPRATHLIEATRERLEDREALRAFLENWQTQRPWAHSRRTQGSRPASIRSTYLGSCL